MCTTHQNLSLTLLDDGHRIKESDITEPPIPEPEVIPPVADCGTEFGDSGIQYGLPQTFPPISIPSLFTTTPGDFPVDYNTIVFGTPQAYSGPPGVIQGISDLEFLPFGANGSPNIVGPGVALGNTVTFTGQGLLAGVILTWQYTVLPGNNITFSFTANVGPLIINTEEMCIRLPFTVEDTEGNVSNEGCFYYFNELIVP